jgi:hypothetical protein
MTNLLAADSSSLIAFFTGDEGEDTHQILDAVTQGVLLIPPATLVEVFSGRAKNPAQLQFLYNLPLMEVLEGYWLRASLLRSTI